jgi:cytochrome d ubiquinol oxidase subunit I
MFGIDAFHLARAQFGFTIAFHIIFPAFSIGLAAYLMVLEGMWLKTKRVVYLDLYKYWLKIFSVGFAMGVVSGVVMSYQFGTNWSVFSNKAGGVLGPLMAYEVLTAFFLEAGFLGVMLFGMGRVGPKLHFAATCLVSFGTAISMTWIISVNSWMQTPAGYTVTPDGKFEPANWLAVIFNPSFPYRLVHMSLAAFLTVAFIVGGVGGYHLLRARAQRRAPTEATRVMFSMALWMAAIVAPMQILAGDTQGLNTLQYQPAKIAAMEGDFQGGSYQGEKLFGIPNMKTQHTDYAIEIPYAGSLILTHHLSGHVPGLKDFPRADQPYSPILFFTFRIMIAIGFSMAAIGAWSLWCRYRGTLYETPWLHRAAVLLSPAGWIAIICGWMTTEIGRQPYTVYGELRTVDSVSPIALPGVATSFLVFIVVYFVVFGSGIVILLRMMSQQPEPGEEGPRGDEPIRTAGIHPGPAQTPKHGDGNFGHAAGAAE